MLGQPEYQVKDGLLFLNELENCAGNCKFRLH